MRCCCVSSGAFGFQPLNRRFIGFTLCRTVCQALRSANRVDCCLIRVMLCAAGRNFIGDPFNGRAPVWHEIAFDDFTVGQWRFDACQFRAFLAGFSDRRIVQKHLGECGAFGIGIVKGVLAARLQVRIEC